MQPTDVYVADGYSGSSRSREREAKLLEAVEAVVALVDTVDDAILRGARLQAAATLLASGRVRSSMEAAEMVHILEYDLEAVTERDGGAPPPEDGHREGP